MASSQTVSQVRYGEKTAKAPARHKSLFGRLLDAILQADRRYREKCEMEKLGDERLHDIGLTRSSFNKVFSDQYGGLPSDDARFKPPFHSGRW